jgi:hypothetical protein
MHEHVPDEVPLSSSLDTSETSEHPLNKQSRAQHCMHARVRDYRNRIVDVMHRNAHPSLKRRAQKMGMCCVAPTIFAQKGKLPICVADRCRDRMCPTCQAYRAGEVRRRLETCVASCNAVRMLTLTMKHESSEVGACVDALIESFRRLRKHKEWKKHVRGGAYVIETTTGSDGNHWHVHIHVLVDGVFWNQKDIQACWSTAVGAPSIAHIQAIHERQKTVRYITKYVSKAVDAGSWTDDQLCEYAIGMHRRRLMGTFGKWHRVKIDEMPNPMSAVAKESVKLPVSLLLEAIEQHEIDVNDFGPQLRLLGKVWRNMIEPYRSTDWVEAVIGANDPVHELNKWLIEMNEVMTRSVFEPSQAKEPKQRQEYFPWLV